MQKKHFLLVVVSLALLSTVWFVAKGNMGYGLMGSLMGGRMYPTEPMMDQVFIEDGVGGGMGGVVENAVVSEKMALPSAGVTMEMMPPYYYGDDALYAEERYYEKSSYHSVVVNDVSKYMRGLKEYFSSINAVVLNSSMNSGDKYESASLYVKVPVDKFDEATGRITEEVKKVIDESVNASDITGQVVNTQENVTVLKEQKALKEAQLKDAKTEVEKTRIQIDIDRLTRQIASAEKVQENVETRTEYASISVTAASSEKYFNPGSTGDFGYELERAWESLKSFVKVLAVFGIWVVVYSVVWAPVVWIVGKVVRRFKK